MTAVACARTTPTGETSVHATCVCVGATGVLIRGDAGAGKSSLALRLIDRGAALVADDRVRLDSTQGELQASAPAALAGLLEVRGLGLCRLPDVAAGPVPVHLVVDLVAPGAAERVPAQHEIRIEGHKLAYLRLETGDPAAAEKVRMAVAALCTGRVALTLDLGRSEEQA